METIECCSMCNASIKEGFIRNDDKEPICYNCVADIDKHHLLHLGVGQKTCRLYWNTRELSNWPGTLKITPTAKKVSTTNWGLIRTDMWFKIEGKAYHGKHIGRNTQICHIQRIAS